jgi:hypothetical protein
VEARPPEEITARRIAVVDEAGRERIVLSTKASWRPWVEVLDDRGVSRIQLGGFPDDTYGLIINREGGLGGLEIIVADWGAIIRLRDKSGLQRAQWFTRDDGSAVLMFVGPTGHPVFQLGPPEAPEED